MSLHCLHPKFPELCKMTEVMTDKICGKEACKDVISHIKFLNELSEILNLGLKIENIKDDLGIYTYIRLYFEPYGNDLFVGDIIFPNEVIDILKLLYSLHNLTIVYIYEEQRLAIFKVEEETALYKAVTNQFKNLGRGYMPWLSVKATYSNNYLKPDPA